MRQRVPGEARNAIAAAFAGCHGERPENPYRVVDFATIEAEQFEVSRLEQTTMPKAPKFVRPLIVGSATSPS